MKFKVKIRRHLAGVRAEAEPIDGNIYDFIKGWVILKSDSSLYAGEMAMISIDPDYPEDAPSWIASGDLIATEKK